MSTKHQSNDLQIYERKFREILRQINLGNIEVAKQKCDLYANQCKRDRIESKHREPYR